MSKIYINGDANNPIEGSFSFDIGYDAKANPPVITIEGVLSTKSYIEEIYAIENERYFLDDVVVTHESYGSEEDEIVYTFMAGKFDYNRKDVVKK